MKTLSNGQPAPYGNDGCVYSGPGECEASEPTCDPANTPGGASANATPAHATSTSVPTTTTPATTMTSPLAPGVGPTVVTPPQRFCPSGTHGGLYATQISIGHVSCGEAYALIAEFNNSNTNDITDSAGQWSCDVLRSRERISCVLFDSGGSRVGSVGFVTPGTYWGP